MKKLDRLLKGHKSLVFLDFEGTQFSHEMIAIGAVSVVIDVKSGRIKKERKPFKIFVKAKNKIGKYVVDLTGITEKTLVEQGVSFADALEALKKYCGISFKKSTFITFGNHDLRILGQSIAHNMDAPREICSIIQKNYVDFAAFISDYVRDAKGNPLSLVHYCELFSVPEAGQAHDPEVDAVNLAHLYDAVVKNKELMLTEYKKYLQIANSHYPEPVSNAIKKLAAGEDVTAKDFEDSLKEYLQ